MRPPFSTQPNSMAKARRPRREQQAKASTAPGPSGPKGGERATQVLPAGRNLLSKGPHKKRRFGSFAAVGKGTRRRSGGILLFMFFPAMERTKDPRGLGSEECQHSSRPPPDPHYGGRIPENCSSNPARAVQLIVPASPPLPLAGFWDESRAGWTKKRAWCKQP